MRNPDEKSWFYSMKDTLKRHDMLSIYSLLKQDISKSQWKKLLNSSVNLYEEDA